MTYAEYLLTKGLTTADFGFPVAAEKIHGALFPFQREIVAFLLKKGRAAAFLDTGLGKTIIQLEWARQLPGKKLIVAPLAVAHQTMQEGKRHLGIEIGYSKDGRARGEFTITNYERIHLFDASEFKGVVLDESSILKSFMGKTKQSLCEMFARTPYRLACTATPAPNDYMELGNHSEFLGIMPGTEMLSRWFINDPANVGKYRLKGHAVKPFWNWVSSWAACISKPSDLGYSNEGYDLPPLKIETIQINTELKQPTEDGMLFDLPVVNASGLGAAKRDTVAERVEIVARMVNGSTKPFLVWCETNQESEMLTRAIPDAVEVKGSHPADLKESRLVDFSEGRSRVLVSKSSICGFGMNWQHCRDIVFASISYSYEKFYQAVRRSWRFGQTEPVNVTVLISDVEIPVWRIVREKSENHETMKSAMNAAAMDGESKATRLRYERTEIVVPPWMKRI